MRKALPQLCSRSATIADLDAIRRIYNESIEDRIAMLDESPKDEEDMRAWWSENDERNAIVICEDGSAKSSAGRRPIFT